MPGLTHRLRLGFSLGLLVTPKDGDLATQVPTSQGCGCLVLLAEHAWLLVLGWWDPWGWHLASPSSLIAGTVVCSGVGSPVPHPKASNSAFVLLQVPSARGRNPSL